jgi:hypothetical protein
MNLVFFRGEVTYGRAPEGMGGGDPEGRAGAEAFWRRALLSAASDGARGAPDSGGPVGFTPEGSPDGGGPELC